MASGTIQQPFDFNTWNIYSIVTEAGETVTVNIPSSYRGIFYTLDSNSNFCGAWFLFSTSAGVVSIKEIVGASMLTFDTATANKLIVSKQSNVLLYFIFLESNGRASI